MRRFSCEKLEHREMLTAAMFEHDYAPDLVTHGEGLSEVFKVGRHFVTVDPVDANSYVINAKDVNQRPLDSKNAPGNPKNVVPFKDKLFLFFDDSSEIQGGQRVMAFDPEGGALQLVRDISPFGTQVDPETARPFQFTFGEHLYFLADAKVTTNDLGEQISGKFGLWRTDGTEAGTNPVLDLIPGLTNVHWNTEVNGQLLLSVQTLDGPSLWVFDGTADGTIQIADKHAEEPSVVGGLAYFSMDSPSGRELHVSDGTIDGTRLVGDLNPGPDSSNPSDLTPFEDGLLFTTPDFKSGLWYSDGTFDGTRLLFEVAVIDFAVADLAYVTSGADEFHLHRVSLSEVDRIFTHDLQLELVANTATRLLFRAGEEHYTTAKQLQPQPFEMPGEFQLATSRHFFFTSETVTVGEVSRPNRTITSYFVQPWISDGSRFSTKKFGTGTNLGKVVDDPAGEFHQVIRFQELEGWVVWHTGFYGMMKSKQVYGNSYVLRPIKTELTPKRLSRVGFDPTYHIGQISEPYLLQNRLVHIVNLHEQYYWADVIDPVDNSTVRFEVTGKWPYVAQANQVVQVDERLFIFIDASLTSTGGGPGQEVWTFDTEHGFKLLRDISQIGTDPDNMVFPWGTSHPFQFTFQDLVYFTANDSITFENGAFTKGDFGLWRTDGTEGGTTPVVDLIPGLEEVVWSKELDGRMLLSVRSEDGLSLWTFDGTHEGSRPIMASISSEPIVVDGLVYFAADSVFGRELFVSDGTIAGTRLYIDLNAGEAGSKPRHIFHFGDGVIFRADGGSGERLWYAPRTARGGDSGKAIQLFDRRIWDYAVADSLYFTVRGEPHRLYRAVGEQVELVFTSDAAIKLLSSTSEMLLFSTGEEHYTVGAKSGHEIPVSFKLPGELRLTTPEHFVFVDDVAEHKPFSSFPRDYYTVQPWISDGTREGTRAVAEPATVRESGLPDWFRVSRVEKVSDALVVTVGFPINTFDYGYSAFRFNLTPTEPPISGDADRDGDVDFADFLTLSAHFGKTDAVFTEGDFDNNGTVDFDDFVLLAKKFGTRTNN